MNEITKEKIECQRCFWVGTYYELESPFSEMEPSCPECWGSNFLEIELDKPPDPIDVFKDADEVPLSVYDEV